MQYEATTPEEYLTLLEEDWRKETLLKLRKLVLSANIELEERIEYKMLAFGNSQGNIFHLNAQKNYVSLYVGDTKKVDPDGKLLKGLNLGKGCIRFSKSVNPADTQIKEFIDKTIGYRIAGKDVAC